MSGGVYRSHRTKRGPVIEDDKGKRCVASCWDGMHNHQCLRKGKHEEDGHWWCTQHLPSRRREKDEARRRKWEREWREKEERRKQGVAKRQREAAALVAIEKIAAGHNDPRALAQEVMQLKILDSI